MRYIPISTLDIDRVGWLATHRCGRGAVGARAVELDELALVRRVRGGRGLVEPVRDENREASGVGGQLYGQQSRKHRDDVS